MLIPSNKLLRAVFFVRLEPKHST